nr:MAG TPA: hypothetical protein [Caudoviricetes sp.]
MTQSSCPPLRCLRLQWHVCGGVCYGYALCGLEFVCECVRSPLLL